MGAAGSTRWKGHQKKKTVEQCEFDPESGWEVIDSGFLGKQKAFDHLLYQSDEYWDNDDVPDGKTIPYQEIIGIGGLEVSVKLETTSQNFAGKRWWFICETCNRRVKKLYAPSANDDFACRTCQNLTYTSSQMSHCKFA